MSEIHIKSGQPFIEGHSAPVETVDQGIKRQILGFGKSLMICRVEFEKDSVGQVHSHHHSQSSYVESGRFLVTIGGEERILSAGDCFYVEPHVDHGAVCLEAGVLLDTFSPVREDFLSSGEQL